MSRFIANKNVFVGFVPGDALLKNPTSAAIITAFTATGEGIDLTDIVSSVNASAQGNVLPTPSLKSLFETTMIGTSQATCQIEGYQDDDEDDNLLVTHMTRDAKGLLVIGRVGFSDPPKAGDIVELWPIQVASQTKSPLANNTVQTVSVTAAVLYEPKENFPLGS